MIATSETSETVAPDEWRVLRPTAACANKGKAIPGNDDNFTIRRSPDQEELDRLMHVLAKSDQTSYVTQAAVWIVTDNADYSELGVLAFGPLGTLRAINEETAVQAMIMCEQAGIDITRKAIWRDRERILQGLGESGLRHWLQAKQ